MSIPPFNPTTVPFHSSFLSSGTTIDLPSVAGASPFSPFTAIPSPDLTVNKHSRSHFPPPSSSSPSTASSRPQSQPQPLTTPLPILPALEGSLNSNTPSPESPSLPTPGTNPRALPWTGIISGSTIASRMASVEPPSSIAPRSTRPEYSFGPPLVPRYSTSDQTGPRSLGNENHLVTSRENERRQSYSWQSSGPREGLAAFIGSTVNRHPPSLSNRPALGDLNLNLGPTATPSLGLASPFVPADPGGVWGPPPPSMVSQVAAQTVSVEERLAQAEEKIRSLTLENQQLRGSRQIQPHSNLSPQTSLSPTLYSSSFADSVTQPGYGTYAPPRMRQDDFESFGTRSTFGADRSDPSMDSVPSMALVNSVLQGTFDYSQMHHAYIRPIVWVVAHRQPRNNSESGGLKAAVNALATRLTLPRESEAVIVLIDAILEWAKALCFTSCGNYLCQQLLEKGEADDKRKFIQEIQEDLVPIASDKFGTHVLCKAVAVKELEESIADALIKHGIFESFKTGARRLWREYLEKCRQCRNFDIFVKINDEMEGRWAELACANEHGSIAVQQVFEVFGSHELMEPCFRELLNEISRVANNQFGHFVVTKLIGYPPLYRPACDAILGAYPPVATSHHGVNFAKIALTEGGRASIVKYVEAICNTDDGKTPGIVAIATSSIGKAHLTFVLSCLTPGEHVRVRQVCRAFSTTLRNSQSGNDLLRSLGLIHAVGGRHRHGI
ncbi:armadillo-type protein [Kockovaella imperatae]|uniref:Armadillo-type protein n=1 Tax=Kockovaella imperatae TaxID=4999 RepID=A0A1Y1ULG3_9TREE|nr:armadillo-type protein [Kockovaella imperatae]ORX37965.1 armadillo-type protein [Kockovaella imperatae]